MYIQTFKSEHTRKKMKVAKAISDLYDLQL